MTGIRLTRRRRAIARALLFVVFVVALAIALRGKLPWVPGSATPARVEGDDLAEGPLPFDPLRTSLVGSQMLASHYNPSFEMAEIVDFVWTPGLLVQEAISPEVVITYPEE